MNAKPILALGIVLAILLPPGVTSFFLGAVFGLISGQLPVFYAPSMVNSSMLYVAILYLAVEAVFTVLLLRLGRRSTSWAFAALALLNLAVGIFLFQSATL